MAVNCSSLNSALCQQRKECYISTYNNSSGTFMCSCSPGYGNLGNNSQRCIQCDAYYYPYADVINGCNNVPQSYYSFYGVEMVTDEICKNKSGKINRFTMQCKCSGNDIAHMGKCYKNSIFTPLNCSQNYDSLSCEHNYQCSWNVGTRSCGCNTGRGFFRNATTEQCQQCPPGYYLNRTTNSGSTTEQCSIPNNTMIPSVSKTEQINQSTCISAGLILANSQCSCPTNTVPEGQYGCITPLNKVKISYRNAPPDVFSIALAGLIIAILIVIGLSIWGCITCVRIRKQRLNYLREQLMTQAQADNDDEEPNSEMITTEQLA